MYPVELFEKLTPEMPDTDRKALICEWLREELKKQSSMEFSQYLTAYEYEYGVGIQNFVLTLKFPLEFPS